MNYIPAGEPKFAQRFFSVIAIAALVIGGFASLISASSAYAQTATTSDSNASSSPTASVSPSLSQVGIVPNSGMITAGRSTDVYLRDANSLHDLTVTGACTVNGVDVANSFQNLTDGLYKVVYTVGANDAEQQAGQIPVNCTLGDANGNTTASAWNDGNSLSIDTNNDGVIGAPANNGGNSTTTSSGSTGGGSNSTTTSSGSNGNAGSNSGASSTPITLSFVNATPVSGTLHQSAHVLVTFQEAHGMTDLQTNGACTINGVDVSNALENLSGGSYRLTYTIGVSDADRAAGTLPISCNLKSGEGATATISAFTDGNQVAIDALDDGINPPANNATTTSATSTPSTGNNSGNNSGGTSTTTSSGSSGNNSTTTADAPLALTGISALSTSAVANGGFAQGWAWTFHLTVPNGETKVALKFSDWTSSNGSIPVAGNMRISSAQATSTDAIVLTGSNTYSIPLTMTGDLDPSAPGRQVDVKVEMQIPTGTANGSYSTSYGVQSAQ